MRPCLAFVFLGVVAVSQCKRPPWYKPCWIYLCGLDITNPVCAWDPHHGARIFRNDCERARHNFCYNRNYALIDNDNTVDEDIKLCGKLRTILENTDDETAMVQDGNVRVHFLEDNKRSKSYMETEHGRRKWNRSYRSDDTVYDKMSSESGSSE